MANEVVGIYEPGRDITGRTTAAVVGKTFLQISGARSSGNIAVATATAGGRVFGVAKYDQPTVGDIVAVARGNSRVTQVTAQGAISAFQEVEVGTGGTAKAKNTGIAVGYAVDAAADATDAQISLY
jgi:hypothetical protein